MFLTLFSACGRSEESVVNTKNSSFIEQEEVVDSPAKIFFSAWNGSEITADTAREHGMISWTLRKKAICAGLSSASA